MNDFEQLSNIKNSQKISVNKPKGELQHILSELESEHKLRHVFGQIQLNFDPLAFRSEAINFPGLIESLSEKYQLEFKAPAIIEMAKRQTGQVDKQLYHQAFESREGLDFRHGLVSYEQKGDNQQIVLRRVNVHGQNITVALDGTTDEAEVVAQKIAADMLENQGLHSSWSNFRKRIGGIGYLSTSMLDLGFNPMRLLSDEMNSFISEDIENDLGFKMADKPLDGPTRCQEDFIYKCVLDELKFKVSVFDKNSGSQDYFEFRFDTSDRRSRGSGVVAVTSQLKFEDHMHALHSLIRRFVKPLTSGQAATQDCAPAS
ncbi:hypothetical protein [uncultured Thiohalocapsa sp.]|uniref:hypothetical protein n=1 Tax=uncultured Thiohalocapsa sp. TaxID=768990 RepID=UPI0025F87547|nr:hypothetical protein [uncultured Thiohalocapsa sp.]